MLEQEPNDGPLDVVGRREELAVDLLTSVIGSPRGWGAVLGQVALLDDDRIALLVDDCGAWATLFQPDAASVREVAAIVRRIEGLRERTPPATATEPHLARWREVASARGWSFASCPLRVRAVEGAVSIAASVRRVGPGSFELAITGRYRVPLRDWVAVDHRAEDADPLLSRREHGAERTSLTRCRARTPPV